MNIYFNNFIIYIPIIKVYLFFIFISYICVETEGGIMCLIKFYDVGMLRKIRLLLKYKQKARLSE